MLAVFSGEVVEVPAELVAAGSRTPSPKTRASELVARFLGTCPSAVSVRLAADLGHLAYSNANQALLRPRYTLLAAVEPWMHAELLLFRLPSTNKSRALPLLAWVSISKASCRIRFACWSLETLLCLHDCVDRSNCYRFVSSSYQEKQSPSVALFFSFFSSCTCVADRRGPTRRHALPLTTHLPRPHTVVQREKERGREFVC
jgi:hypothetical protein